MKARAKAKWRDREFEIDRVGTSDGYLYDWSEVELLDNLDYWEKLKHQYAGMAMQTILEKSHNEDYHTNLMTSWSKCGAEEVARLSVIYATALVEVLKKSDV